MLRNKDSFYHDGIIASLNIRASVSRLFDLILHQKDPAICQNLFSIKTFSHPSQKLVSICYLIFATTTLQSLLFEKVKQVSCKCKRWWNGKQKENIRREYDSLLAYNVMKNQIKDVSLTLMKDESNVS